jgi:hypothetical protein
MTTLAGLAASSPATVGSAGIARPRIGPCQEPIPEGPIREGRFLKAGRTWFQCLGLMRSHCRQQGAAGRPRSPADLVVR